MVKLSFFVLLTLLVALCAAENGELGVKNEGYPKNDVETTWKKFMVRLTKNMRTTREASERELNLLKESPGAAIDEENQDKGVDDFVIKANENNRASQSCSSSTGCTATASETNTSQSSSTGTSSTSTGTSSSSSNSNNNANSNSSTGGGSSSSSSSSGSSSSSSSSG